jgi:hypothetical protein
MLLATCRRSVSLETEVNQSRAEVGAEVNQSRAELRAEVNQSKAELRAEVNQSRAEVRAGDVKENEINFLLKSFPKTACQNMSKH